MSTAELLAEAERSMLADPSDESDELWVVLWVLHERGERETFDAAVASAASDDPARRKLAADLLNDFGYSIGRPYRDESARLLSTLCGDSDSCVVGSAVSAAGKLGDFDARVLAGCARHVDDGVRFSVACALSFRTEPEAVEALIALMSDPIDDVRDWATFGLGSGDADSAVIRSALTARLTDEHKDTRCEAIFGLAKRGVADVIPFVERELDTTAPLKAVEAAEVLADPRLVSALERLAADYPNDADIERALAACRRA